MRFSVGAVNVKTANFVYFDSTTHRIGPAHIIASGSLPPGFPATEIDGEYYWDGGLVSNTPLQWVLDSRPRHAVESEEGLTVGVTVIGVGDDGMMDQHQHGDEGARTIQSGIARCGF
jgi:predicted acylesterase/phospholipase RssA